MLLNVPQTGFVCQRIPMKLEGFIQSVSGWHIIRDHYEIKGLGRGNDVFCYLFNKIQDEKTHTNLISPVWDDLLVIKTGLYFPPLRDENKTNEENFDNIIGKDAIPQRKADVLLYADTITSDWAPPLFISGTVFGQKGVAYMLDGARRIVATVLRGWLSAPALLVVTKAELCGYFNQHDIEKIRERAKAVSWFPNYQAIPEVGIEGRRTGDRLKMFDLTAIKGKTIADFGVGCGTYRKILGIDYYWIGIEIFNSWINNMNLLKEFILCENFKKHRL